MKVQQKKRKAILGGISLGAAVWSLLLVIFAGAAQASPTMQAAVATLSPAQTLPETAVQTAVQTPPAPQTLKFFNVNTSDLIGPPSHGSNYGKIPEIIVATNDGTSFTVLAQNYTTTVKAAMLQVEPDATAAGEYTITHVLLLTNTVPNTLMLDRIMGLDIDSAGNRYYAIGVSEGHRVNSSYPAPDEYRSNIVRVIKMDPAGQVLFNIDLDPARKAAFSDAAQLINPMVAATSRLMVAGNEIALVHGINTEPDWDIGGTRHQRAVTTRLNATTGAISAPEMGGVSHSFDQRLLRDGNSILAYHLGDAFPRAVALIAPSGATKGLFFIKGFTGENQTRTRIGNVAVINASSEVTYTYLALFATESVTRAVQQMDGPRNLAIQRVSRTDYSVDPTMRDVFTVTSGNNVVANRLQWLTYYTATETPVPDKTPIVKGLSADRPKLVGIGNNQFVVLWEQWYVEAPPYPMAGGVETFQGVYGMVIDAAGTTVVPATLLTAQEHLPRGDDAFRMNNGVAWMAADDTYLYMHAVDVANGALRYTRKSILLPRPTGGLATFQGTVTAVGGAPIAGAVVTLAGTGATAATDAEGRYAILALPGTYTLTVTAYPYQAATIPNVSGSMGAALTTDVQLTQQPPGTLTGRVTAKSGTLPLLPLYARVQFQAISGAISTTVWTDPHTGLYTATLYQGMAYSVMAVPWQPEYQSASLVVTPTGAISEQNFVLGASLPPSTLFTDEFSTNASPANNWTVNSKTQGGNWKYWDATVFFNSSPTEGTSAGAQARMFRQFDFTTKLSPSISLWLAYASASSPNDRLQVQVCTQVDCNADSSWTNVGDPMRPVDPPPVVGMRYVPYTRSLEAYAGQVVQVGVLGVAGGGGRNMHVDRLVVNDGGRVGGGMIVGAAYNQSDVPLAGVVVTDGRSTVTTTVTPNDPAVADSFYALWMPAGSTVITATVGGATPIVRTVNVISGTVQRQDFVFTITGLTPTPTPTSTPETPTPETPTPTPTPTSTPTPAPTPVLEILRLEPNQGLGGITNEVIVHGKGLRADTVILIGDAALGDVQPNAQGTQASAVAPGDLAPGVHAVTAVNPDGTSFTLQNAYTVIDGSLPDLSVSDSDLWFSPAAVRQGAETSIGVNVHRSGGNGDIGGVEVSFYLDEVSEGALLGRQTAGAFSPGNDVVVPVSIPWTPDTAGSHTVYAVIDSSSMVAEGAEANNSAQWTVDVLPPSAATQDTTPPTLTSVMMANAAQSTAQPEVTLAINATDEGSGVRWMYVVERVYNSSARSWVIRQESGWTDFAASHALTLSPVPGVHYLQVWVADAAGNTTDMSKSAAINYLPEPSTVLSDQARIYRLELAAGEQLLATLTPSSGDPDLYVWDEAGNLVAYSNLYDLETESVEFSATEAGVYQIEVYGYASSSYTMTLEPGAVQVAGAAFAPDNKDEPLTPSVSPAAVPAARQALPAAPEANPEIFLPLINR